MRATSRTRSALSSLLVLAACLTMVAAPASATETVASAETGFVARVNAERTRRGLRPLAVRSDLRSIARGHSQVMARRDDLHHNPDVWTDVTNWQRLTENVGYGPSVTWLHGALMRSDGHRRNILDPKVTEVGVGVAFRGDVVWVTQVFRLPKRPVAPPAPPRKPGPDRVRLTGDWNGDGVERPGWWRRGEVVLLRGNGQRIRYRVGGPGSYPVVGDFDGDGVDTVGVVTDGVWDLRNRHGGGGRVAPFRYGRVGYGDVPVVGDWNADGRDTVGVVRGNRWLLRDRNSRGHAHHAFGFGRRTDQPIVGDWNGDGRDTVGVVRGRSFFLRDRLSRGRAHRAFAYGAASDGAVVGDWDGDGDTTVGVGRGADWLLRQHNSRGPASLRLRLAVV